jgi:LacI family transcriptional regulator
MPVRMKDIARELGVSVVTVSKVLRNHSDISPETRQRVLQLMKKLNYRPNLAARALVTGRSFIVGLVVPDLVHPFFGVVAKGLSQALRQRGYNLVLASSEEDPELEREEIEQMLARRVDAIVVASAQEHFDSFHRIEEHGTPYILIDRKFPGLVANFIGIDDEVAGARATEHLIQAGCRLIAHIGGPAVSTAIGRLEGYRRALRDHGLEIGPEYIVTRVRGDEASDATGHDAMQKLLQLTPRPDGLFCYNDPTALGAMKAILEAGLRIPEDIAVAGCGNVRYSDFLRVPLTSIDQDSEAIGVHAAELAVALIESKTLPSPKTIIVEPRLVVRDSTRRLRDSD